MSSMTRFRIAGKFKSQRVNYINISNAIVKMNETFSTIIFAISDIQASSLTTYVIVELNMRGMRRTCLAFLSIASKETITLLQVVKSQFGGRRN